MIYFVKNNPKYVLNWNDFFFATKYTQMLHITQIQADTWHGFSIFCVKLYFTSWQLFQSVKIIFGYTVYMYTRCTNYFEH